MLQLLPKRYLYSPSWQNIGSGEQYDTALSTNTEDTCLSLKLSCCDMSSFDSGVRNCCTMFRGFRSASWCKICNTNHLVKLQVLIVMTMKTAAFCDVMSCTLAHIYWCFSHKKVRVNLSVLDHEDLKGGIEVFLHSFLTSPQDVGRWLASNPWRKSPGTPWIRGWVDSRASLDIWEKRTIFCPCQDLYPGSSNL